MPSPSCSGSRNEDIPLGPPDEAGHASRTLLDREQIRRERVLGQVAAGATVSDHEWLLVVTVTRHRGADRYNRHGDCKPSSRDRHFRL